MQEESSGGSSRLATFAAVFLIITSCTGGAEATPSYSPNAALVYSRMTLMAVKAAGGGMISVSVVAPARSAAVFAAQAEKIAAQVSDASPVQVQGGAVISGPGGATFSPQAGAAVTVGPVPAPSAGTFFVQTTSITQAGGSPSSQTQSLISTTMTTLPKVWADAVKRRSRIQIYIEMMELMKRGAMSPFEVAFYVRLNHKRAKAYVEELEERGVIQRVDEDGKTLYVLTRDGASFLERAKAVFLETRLIEVRTYAQERDF